MKKYLLSFSSILVTISIFAQVPSYVPTNGLVGWWPFTGNANDQSGNGNNGTVSGALLTNDRFGNLNSAYSFNVNDFIEVLNNSQFNFQLQNKMSISFWIKAPVNTPISEVHIPISKQTGTGTSQLGWNTFIEDGGGNMGFVVKNGISGTQGYYQTSNAGLWNNTWHHVVFTFNNGTTSIYINNILINTVTTASVVVGDNLGNLRFGHVEWASLYSYLGILDDISIYNRVLSHCEIQGLYNSQNTIVSVSAGNNQTICQNETVILSGGGAVSYSWDNGINNGVPFSPQVGTTIFTVTGTDGIGCTGQGQVTVNVNPNTSSTINPTTCDSYIAPDGQVYASSGNYTAIIPNSFGCDSTITINLTIKNSTASCTILTTCDSYTAPDGQIYNSSGTYFAVIPNAVGCDSTITIDLTITNSNTGNDVIIACDSYTWIDGNIYTSSNNTATQTLTNVNGCDSLVTLDLTLNNSSSSTLNETALDSYTLNGQTYIQSGTYIQTLQNTQGCDSTITLNLTMQFTGIEENTLNSVKFYPNPTNGLITIQSESFEDLVISNLLGNVVLTESKEQETMIIDVSEFPVGIYFIHQNQSVVKFIKQ